VFLSLEITSWDTPVAQLWHRAILFERDTSHSMREVGAV